MDGDDEQERKKVRNKRGKYYHHYVVARFFLVAKRREIYPYWTKQYRKKGRLMTTKLNVNQPLLICEMRERWIQANNIIKHTTIVIIL